MADDIKNLNKQIATFMVVSLALSTAVAANDVVINPPTPQLMEAPMLMYAPPEVPPIQYVEPVNPSVALYAVPDVPVISEPIPSVALYAVPDIPVISEPVNPHQAMYAPPEIPDSNGSQNIINDINGKIEPSANLLNSVGGKINTKNAGNIGNEVSIERATKTDTFVNSKYGVVKVLDRGHFIFK